jgi:NO-binding membrane sensor protein with MHYT domain
MDHHEEGTMNQTGAPLEAFFDLRLIALSFLIAIFASCVVLDFAVRIMVGRGAVRHGWLTGGAILMGVGIWSRPFVGMRAFPLAIPVRYDVPAVLLPFLVAILESVIGLEVASGARFMRREELAGSLVMGRGIAPMRCLGMAVMRLPATSHGNPFLRGLAAVIAVVASLPVLTVPCNFHVESRWKWAKASSAAVMTAAISLLHYTSIPLLCPRVRHVWGRRMCLCI